MFRERKAQSVTEFAILGSLIIVAFAFLINYSEKLNRQQSCIQQTFRAALEEARNANNSASYTKLGFRRMPNLSSPMELGQLQSFSSSASVLWADGKNSRKEAGEDAKGVMRYKDIPGVVKYQLNEAPAISIPQPETLHNLRIDLEDAGVDSKITGGISDIETALGGKNPDYAGQAEVLSGYIAQLGVAGVSPGIIDGLKKVLTSLKGETAGTNTDTFTNTVDAQTTFVKNENPSGTITTTRTLNVTDTLVASVTIDNKPYTFTHTLGEKGRYYPGDNTLSRSRSMQ